MPSPERVFSLIVQGKSTSRWISTTFVVKFFCGVFLAIIFLFVFRNEKRNHLQKKMQSLSIEVTLIALKSKVRPFETSVFAGNRQHT